MVSKFRGKENDRGGGGGGRNKGNQRHLVDGHAILVVHFVELIDEAHALVRQHKRAALYIMCGRA